MQQEPLREVVLVEDDIDIQKIAYLALSSVGHFKVTVFGSGREFLDHLDEISPQLILLDVMMPGMDGPTTLQELRKNQKFSKVPVIFLTAKVQSHEISRYRSMGAAEVISKPFDPMTLATTLSGIWESLTLQESSCKKI